MDDGSCAIGGCTKGDAPSYAPHATLDDGSCEPVAYGCLDSRALNFALSATHTDGGCRLPGCTDSRAANFDASSTAPDGTCRDAVSGCADSRADNFLPAAEADDGSCALAGCTAARSKWPLDRALSSACVAPQGAAGGSGRRGTPRGQRPSRWAPSRRLRGSSEPPPKEGRTLADSTPPPPLTV